MAEKVVTKLETILVVDDTPMILKVVGAILNGANFNVLEARSGEEAIAIAANYTSAKSICFYPTCRCHR